MPSLDPGNHAGLGALALVSRLVGKLRRSGKPLHPHGVVLDGVLTRTGSDRSSGVAWLDGRGSDTVLLRRSRGAGLPSPLPDVEGLAIRVPTGQTHADILLSSAGLGLLTRFVPVPSRIIGARPLSSLMPYRGRRGPLLIAARPTGEEGYALLWATPRSDWVPFGRLTLSGHGARDASISFDPFSSSGLGLETYGWTRRLREPAYRAAREQRRRRCAIHAVAPTGQVLELRKCRLDRGMTCASADSAGQVSRSRTRSRTRS